MIYASPFTNIIRYSPLAHANFSTRIMFNLQDAIAVLSSMIAPVVLIMASGSLIMTTSTRLGRVIDRTRKLTEYLRELAQKETKDDVVREEAKALSSQMHTAARRARLLQQAMSLLYLTLSIFVATSIALGVTDISHIRQTWIPLALGILGTTLLFYASILLITESRIAIKAVNQEMSYSIQFFNRHFPETKRTDKSPLWKQLLTLLRG